MDNSQSYLLYRIACAQQLGPQRNGFEGLPRTKIRNWYLKSAYEHYIVLSNSIVDYLL